MGRRRVGAKKEVLGDSGFVLSFVSGFCPPFCLHHVRFVLHWFSNCLRGWLGRCVLEGGLGMSRKAARWRKGEEGGAQTSTRSDRSRVAPSIPGIVQCPDCDATAARDSHLCQRYLQLRHGWSLTSCCHRGLRGLEKIKILSQNREVENCLWRQRKVAVTCSDGKVTEAGVSFHYQGRALGKKVLCCFWSLVTFLACVFWFVTYFVLEVSKVVMSCKDMS